MGVSRHYNAISTHSKWNVIWQGIDVTVCKSPSIRQRWRLSAYPFALCILETLYDQPEISHPGSDYYTVEEKKGANGIGTTIWEAIIIIITDSLLKRVHKYSIMYSSTPRCIFAFHYSREWADVLKAPKCEWVSRPLLAAETPASNRPSRRRQKNRPRRHKCGCKWNISKR